MTPRRVLVIGSGARVRDAALPAFASLAPDLEVAGIVARTAKRLECAGRSWDVRAAEDLDGELLRGADLVYVAVGKKATPEVLARLERLAPGHAEVLVETPVVTFRHWRHAARLRAFRRAWVAEDTVWLPWYETVAAALGAGAIGELEGVTFERSAYAYHGVAMAKALLGSERVLSARRTRLPAGARRSLRFAGGRTAAIVEPRDYALGRVVVAGSRGRISDAPGPGEQALALEPLLEGGTLVGFRVGEHATRLLPEEVELARGDPAGLSVTARMQACKRVGFRRMLVALLEGRGYPLEQGLEDMVVDFFLEKLGWWRPTPLTDPRSPLAGALWTLAGSLRS